MKTLVPLLFLFISTFVQGQTNMAAAFTTTPTFYLAK